MKLVIAEKPSVAHSIARVIGAAGRKDGYLEGNGYLVSWCVGHLVELSAPETYDERYSKWRLEDLPILPDSWRYQVSSGTKKQFGILKELMKRPDEHRLCDGCGTGGGTHFPAGLSAVWVPEAGRKTVDLIDGGCGHPGGIPESEALRGI